jgi:hypothetical protein
MVREGCATSGEGNGTTVGNPKMGGGEALPLLSRDANYSSVPGSDAEAMASDAGSGNEGLKKSARGRASLHDEVLLANKTLKKKPYKSLGWSLIAVRARPASAFSAVAWCRDETQERRVSFLRRAQHPPFVVSFEGKPRRTRASRRLARATARRRAAFSEPVRTERIRSARPSSGTRTRARTFAPSTSELTAPPPCLSLFFSFSRR